MFHISNLGWVETVSDVVRYSHLIISCPETLIYAGILIQPTFPHPLTRSPDISHDTVFYSCLRVNIRAVVNIICKILNTNSNKE